MVKVMIDIRRERNHIQVSMETKLCAYKKKDKNALMLAFFLNEKEIMN